MKFYSNGKLLLTGEYLVLDGAKSLALPTKYGQHLIVRSNPNTSLLVWKSFDLHNKIWFECEINLNDFLLISTTNVAISNTLLLIFKEVKKTNPNFLNTNNGVIVETNLDFDRSWGLGTSSTLINNIASWAKIDAFDLQFKIFGGSAYDIACAEHDTPILYQLAHKKPIIEAVTFNPVFKDNLFFIHLNEKQNSRDAIKAYRSKAVSAEVITEISVITNQILTCKSLLEFEILIERHEQILSRILEIKPIKERLFNDYYGQIKSLGAWGGDFILATGQTKMMNYFERKGYKTIIPFSKMLL